MAIRWSSGALAASCMAIALLLTVPIAGASFSPSAVAIMTPPDGSTVTGLTTLTGTTAMARDLNGDGFVIIAVVDSGINPYNPEFTATAEQPGAGFTDPATYISGYPAGVTALALTCTATTAIDTACTGNFAGIPYGVSPYAAATATTGMRWIQGSKIIAAISFDSAKSFGPTAILDEAPTGGHGTMSAAVAVGNTVGTCPMCLLVVVEGLGGTALDWASNQPWIDFTSNSYGIDMRGLVGVPPDPTAPALYLACAAATCAAPASSKVFTERGGTALFAAGNGNINAFESPQSTHASPLAGPDWHMVVGAVDKDTGSSILGSGKPVTISSYGLGDIPAACYKDLTTACTHSGTSAATPQTAGVMGDILREARILLRDSSEGPRGPTAGKGVAASGIPVVGNQYLKDGKLTRQELWALTLRSAQALGSSPLGYPAVGGPASKVDYSYVGYGVANPVSRDAAIATLKCGSDLRATPDQDTYLTRDSQLRVAKWGAWAEPKFDFTNGTAGVAACPPPPPPQVTFKVNGLTVLGGALPGPTGAWTFNINFAGFVPVSGQYVVVATYGAYSDTKTYLAPPTADPPVVAQAAAPEGGETPYPQDPNAGKGDLDGDGVIDHFDNCPRLGNPSQSDIDGDSLGDACDDDMDGDGYTNANDDCPGAADRAQRDTNGDGKGDACVDDIDGDGVKDALDNCPRNPNQSQSDLDTDKAGDACDNDRDGDGVDNNFDAFPDDPLNWTDTDQNQVGDQTQAHPVDKSSFARTPAATVSRATAKAPGLAPFAILAALLGSLLVARRRVLG